MNQLLTELTPSLIAIAVILFSTLASWLGIQAKSLLESTLSGQQDTKIRKIVESTVLYVEQVGKMLGSEEKLALAKSTLIQRLNEKGLAISALEIDVLIESSVNAFLSHYNATETVPVIVEGTPIVEGAQIAEAVKEEAK